MRITKHRIINPDIYLGALSDAAPFRIVSVLSDATADTIKRTGFSAPPAHGDTILPRIVGPVSRFNARGRWNVRRDLPKEPRYIRTICWRWEQWTGRGQSEEHEDFRDIVRDCYPRELIPPPSVELTYINQGSGTAITTPELINTPATSEHNKHCINLFLELFGSCDLLAADLGRIAPTKLRKANWRMLPPGEHPWERLSDHIDAALGHRGDDTRRVIWDRQETLKSYKPDEIYVGEAGFDDYLAYVFRRHHIVVLESVRKDNAIYVFGLDWKRVSQLSKGQILSAGLHSARIIHAKGWKTQLARLMARPRAA